MPSEIGIRAFSQENINQFAYIESDSEDQNLHKLRQLLIILMKWYSSTTRDNPMLSYDRHLLAESIGSLTEVFREYANNLLDYEGKIRKIVSSFNILINIDPQNNILNLLLSLKEDLTHES